EVLKGKVLIIRDCYNANPESTAAGIEFCDTLDLPRGSGARKIYVIADMLELGAASQNEHEKLGESLAGSKADMIFLFGAEIEAAASVLKNKNKTFLYTNDIDKLSRELGGYIKDGDMVLLKGSRGCALERLTGVLMPADAGKQGVCNVS
ncbi:MAG: UDP-N-acetylmuramoyl-tripeptide--D-alanyl-D-alanine ligase, partial [Treponema sp.]|nr:UDP-N-acetylmuramoyl-tripeptide--D-alanyl-D-alanine ligase [Treponema sp.]